MSAYTDAYARFLADSATPRRFTTPAPGVPVAQSRPAPFSDTIYDSIFQPLETGNIDGIITQDDARKYALPGMMGIGDIGGIGGPGTGDTGGGGGYTPAYDFSDYRNSMYLGAM